MPIHMMQIDCFLCTSKGITTGEGQAGAVMILGDEFPGLFFTAGIGVEEGLYVETPDARRRSLGAVPVSGDSLFCPDPFSDSRGQVLIDFDPPVRGVGMYFMDMENTGTYLEAFDGTGGTGIALGRVDLPVLGNGVSSFAGVAATSIRSVVLELGVTEGVCIDDLFWVPTTSFTCVGFEPPMANYPVSVKKNRTLPLKAELFDAEGFPVLGSVLTAPPVLQVWYEWETPLADDVSDEALPAGQGTDGNQFFSTNDAQWQFNLKTQNYPAAGTYTVFMESGDETEYVIDPVCMTSFIVK